LPTVLDHEPPKRWLSIEDHLGGHRADRYRNRSPNKITQRVGAVAE